MPFSATLFTLPLTAIPFSHLLLLLVQLTLLGGMLMFFRPLLVGIVRALALTVRPRPSKDELAARRKLRDAKLLLKAGIASATDVRAVAPGS